MAESLTSVALVGCTGLVGSRVLATLIGLPQPPRIHAIARRKLATDSAHVNAIHAQDTSTWAPALQSFRPAPQVFISTLGTTRAQAGSKEAQRSIDYDLNLSLARAAKDAGVTVYVLLSSSGISKQSHFAYLRMKAELEDAVKELGFPHTVIVKPGLLIGDRSDGRLAEAALKGFAKGLRMWSQKWLTDWWAQDADVVANAAIAAASQCAGSKRAEGVWEVGQAEVIRLGKTDWEAGKGDGADG